jgi:hypothetical protein
MTSRLITGGCSEPLTGLTVADVFLGELIFKHILLPNGSLFIIVLEAFILISFMSLVRANSIKYLLFSLIVKKKSKILKHE